MIHDLPHIVDIYTYHLKLAKYLPRLYRCGSQLEVLGIIEYGKNRKDTYLKLTPRDLGYLYADADRRSDDDVTVANWVMNVLEDQLL
jgi:hypothetical protein